MARYQFDQYRFDSSDGSLERPDRGFRYTLRPQVALLLAQFLEQPDQVLSRETLCQAIWGDGRVVDFEAGLSALVKELRQVLAESGASPELVETVPRRGYRFRARQVRMLGDAGPAKRRFGLLWAGAGLGAVLAAAALVWWLAGERDPAPTAAAPSLAILPLERFGDPDRPPEHAELLLADALLARLWQIQLEDLELIGRTSLRPYSDREDVAAAVARDLGVNLLIEGTIIAEPGDSWRVEIRMLAVPAGRVLWSESLEWRERHQLPVDESADQFVNRLAERWAGLRDQAAFAVISD